MKLKSPFAIGAWSLVSTAFLSLLLGMLPVFGVLYWFGVQHGTWVTVLVVQLVVSIAAVLAPASMAAYSASKAGVVALSEAIAAECPRRRPGVTIVCPGFFRSGLLDTWHFTSSVEKREAGRRMAITWWTSDRVAHRVLRAVRRNRRYVVVGLQARWVWRLKRLAPRLTTFLMRVAYRRLK